MTKRAATGPDFANTGRFIDWGTRADIDDHFPAAITTASNSVGLDVELARWSIDDPLAAQYERWWTLQRNAIRRYVGQVPGYRVTIGRRTHRDEGVAICYVRYNRARLAVAA